MKKTCKTEAEHNQHIGQINMQVELLKERFCVHEIYSFASDLLYIGLVFGQYLQSQNQLNAVTENNPGSAEILGEAIDLVWEIKQRSEANGNNKKAPKTRGKKAPACVDT